ncbi:MAG: hypothetical protein JWR22_1219 [Herminiimonas sp.]|nr:hypothetical protein [Herminiimonas sp.]
MTQRLRIRPPALAENELRRHANRNALPLTTNLIQFMKNTIFCIAAGLLLVGCNNQHQLSEASQTNFTTAMNAYLAARGDLCLAKNQWPIVVTREEAELGSRNALQMPVLERLGVVASVAATVEKDAGQGKSSTSGRSYQLTDAGMKFYLAREPRKQATGSAATAQHDLCAARLTLDKIVAWEAPTKPSQPDAGAETIVTYTYKVAAASWTDDAEARNVFPVVDRIVKGAGVLQLKEPFRLTEHGWEAKDL